MDETTTRICTCCHKEFQATKEFFRPVNDHALRAQCRQCERDKFKVWQTAHKDERTEYWRRYHEQHRDKERAYSREWNRSHPEQHKSTEQQ